MKKMRTALKMGGHAGNGLLLPLIPLFIVAIGLWVSPLSVISAFADDKSSTGKQQWSFTDQSKDKDQHDDHDSHDDHSHDDHSHDDHGHDDHEHDHDNDQCTVCHDPHNPHEIKIPCDQVDKYLHDHPGDHRGHCSVTPSKSK